MVEIQMAEEAILYVRRLESKRRELAINALPRFYNWGTDTVQEAEKAVWLL